jgi:hypothetical protein
MVRSGIKATELSFLVLYLQCFKALYWARPNIQKIKLNKNIVTCSRGLSAEFCPISTNDVPSQYRIELKFYYSNQISWGFVQRALAGEETNQESAPEGFYIKI